MSSHNRELGQLGEDAAATWYEAARFTVLERNWRTSTGEIDLICELDGTVVFCEVKTRSTSRFGTGAEAVNWKKQQKVRAVASQWLRQCGRSYSALRFDVADVDSRGTLIVYENCF